MKADHNTITLFGVKVMSKYTVLSKRERGMIIKKKLVYLTVEVFMFMGDVVD